MGMFGFVITKGGGEVAMKGILKIESDLKLEIKPMEAKKLNKFKMIYHLHKKIDLAPTFSLGQMASCWILNFCGISDLKELPS